MKVCPECAESVQDAAKVCKHCGHEFTRRRNTERIVGAVFVVVVVLVILYFVAAL